MPPTISSTDPETLRQTRELGRQQGQIFDLRLRETEASQREGRLTELLWKPEAPAGQGSAESSYELTLLRTQVENLSYYLKAVESSALWRAAQWVRGLFGRAW